MISIYITRRSYNPLICLRGYKSFSIFRAPSGIYNFRGRPILSSLVQLQHCHPVILSRATNLPKVYRPGSYFPNFEVHEPIIPQAVAARWLISRDLRLSVSCSGGKGASRSILRFSEITSLQERHYSDLRRHVGALSALCRVKRVTRLRTKPSSGYR